MSFNEFLFEENKNFILDKMSMNPKPELVYVKDGKTCYNRAYDSGQIKYPSISLQSNYYFAGYELLSQLSTNGIIDSVVSTIVRDMFKNGGKVKYVGESDDSADTVKYIEKRLEALQADSVFFYAIKDAFIYGGGVAYIYVDDDTAKPLVAKISDTQRIKYLKKIDPSYCVPLDVNTNSPLAKYFYVPESWQVLGTPIHSTRLITFIVKDVSDIYKPIFNFFGMSFVQAIYQSVCDLEESIKDIRLLLRRSRTSVLTTNLSNIGDSSQSKARELANRVKTGNNSGVLLLDKENDDFKDVSANLSGLSELLSSFMQTSCIYTGLPVTKFAGQAPKGLNATGEYDMQNYYDLIAGYSKDLLVPAYNRLVDLILQEVGIATNDGYKWVPNPIKSLSEMEQLEAQKAKAEINEKLFLNGVLSTDEWQEQLNKDESNDFTSLGMVEEQPTFEDLLNETTTE